MLRPGFVEAYDVRTGAKLPYLVSEDYLRQFAGVLSKTPRQKAADRVAVVAPKPNKTPAAGEPTKEK